MIGLAGNASVAGPIPASDALYDYTISGFADTVIQQFQLNQYGVLFDH